MCIARLTGKVLARGHHPSPSDILRPTAISRDPLTGVVQINVRDTNLPFQDEPQVWWPPVPNTDSMSVMFDYGHHNILLGPSTERDRLALVEWLSQQLALRFHNVIVYKYPGQNSIIHHLVGEGSDTDGRYFTCQGITNGGVKDPWRIRDKHIKWVAVAPLW